MAGCNIYKRKDGRYEGRIYTVSADGKRRYRSYYGRTLEEVQRKMSVVGIENCCVTEMTVKELFCEWLSVMSSRIKESTASNYRMKAQKHIIPVFGETCCCRLDRRTIYAYIEKALGSGLSCRYVSDIISLLRSVYKYAAREYNIKNVVSDIIVPKRSDAEVKLLSESEQTILKKYIVSNPDRTTLGIAISLYTGVRIGELCALRWSDIDLEKRVITVRSTVQRIQNFDGGSKTKVIITRPKSRSSMRSIPIPDCLSKMMKSFQSSYENYVLSDSPEPVEPRTMQYRFLKILKNAHLPSVHFHSLRHAFATKSIALGFDVKTLSEILGHSSVELTLNRYVHSSMERKRLCMDMMTWNI